jgi:hypothetical protein
LNFTDALRGALVQCPACRHSFVAPEEEAPPPRPPAPDPLPRAVPPVTAALDPFDLDEVPDGLAARHRKALRSAAWWLRSAVVVNFGTSLLGCCTLTVVTEHPDAVLAMMGGTLFFEYIPLILVAVGTPRLQAKRSYGLALTAAILVLPPTLWALLQTGLAVKVALDQREGTGLFFLGLAAVTLFGAAAGVIGAAKALVLLSDAEVRRSFR